MIRPPTPMSVSAASFSATVAGEPYTSECSATVRADGAESGAGIGTMDTPCS